MIPEPISDDLARYDDSDVFDDNELRWIVCEVSHNLRFALDETAGKDRIRWTNRFAIRMLATIEQQRKRAVRAERERDNLQAFKDWVHTYLDENGVPHHPPGTHGAAGCRIGDRMDWLFSQFDELRAEVDRLKQRESLMEKQRA